MKKFLKTKFIIYILVAFIVFLIGSYFLIKFAYSEFFITSPFKTIFKLLSYAKKTNDFNLRSEIYIKIILFMLIPQLILVLLSLLILDKRKINIASEKERATLKGSAQWLTEKTLKNKKIFFDWKNLPDFIFGTSSDANIDSSDSQNLHTLSWGKSVLGCNPSKQQILTIGGTRSYKGVSTIVPTLLNYPHSVIVYDPAKENYNISSGFRSTFGKVQYFNPQDKNSTLHFNPLDWIRHNEDFITIDIANITTIIIPPNAKTEAIWIDNPRNLITIYISYVLLFMEKPKQNLKSVANIANIMNEPSFYNYHKVEERLSQLNEKIEKTKNTQEQGLLYDQIERYSSYLESLSDEEKEAQDIELSSYNSLGSVTTLMKRMLKDIEYGLEIVNRDNPDESWKVILLQQTRSMINKIMLSAKAETTLASCITIADTAMNFFAEEGISRLMKDTTFKLEELQMKDKPMSLYLCIPDVDTERCKRFVQLFISSTIKQLTDDYRKDYKHHLLFILDEFPQLGRLEAVEKSMVYSLKYHISFHLIIQSISQLQNDNAYGREGTKTILGNTSILDIKKVFDIDTAKLISEMLGDKTLIFSNTSRSYKSAALTSQGSSVSIREEKRNLMTPEEIINMNAENEIIIIANVGAKIAKKLVYYENEFFCSRANLPLSITEEYKEQKYDEIEDNNSSEATSFSNFLNLFEAENNGFIVENKNTNSYNTEKKEIFTLDESDLDSFLD